MIDLSKFVDKEVFVTYRNGEIVEAKIIKNTAPLSDYPYICYDLNNEEDSNTYTQTGNYYYQAAYIRDIVDIQLKKQKTITLSDKTIERLAGALAPEAVEYIQQSDEYLQFMTEQLTKFLKERMGEMDNEVAVEIIGIIFADNMNLYVRKPVH
jgi:hypothetical protein